jgi:hypothetical protein
MAGKAATNIREVSEALRERAREVVKQNRELDRRRAASA